jgi:hypothetical protein
MSKQNHKNAFGKYVYSTFTFGAHLSTCFLCVVNSAWLYKHISLQWHARYWGAIYHSWSKPHRTLIWAVNYLKQWLKISHSNSTDSWTDVIGKGKVPMLNEAPCHEDVWGSGGTLVTTCILHLGTRGGWVQIRDADINGLYTSCHIQTSCKIYA